MLGWMRRWLSPSGRGGANPPPRTGSRPAAARLCATHPPLTARPGTAAFDLALVEYELRPGGDLRHGTHHLACLLTYDPGCAAWKELLERYVAAAGDLEPLLPASSDGAFYGVEALRAHIWQRSGRLDDAVQLLVQVARAKPDSTYIDDWAMPWLLPAGAVEVLTRTSALQLFGTVLSSFSESTHLTPRRLALLQRWADISERWFSRHGAHAGPEIVVRAGILRKSGRTGEAITVSQACQAATPSWHGATALGLALWRHGDIARADDALCEAARLDQQDVSALLEAGDMHVEHGQWQLAIERYALAQAREPGQPWAIASSHYARWRLHGDASAMDALTRLSQASDQRAMQLLALAHDWGLPEPSDATANILRDFARKRTEDARFSISGSFRIGVSSLEAPSNYLAAAMQFRAWGTHPAIEVETSEPDGEDPRTCLMPVRWPVWRYAGIRAFPALPAPSDELRQRIADLAGLPIGTDPTWVAACLQAQAIGPDRAAELLAVLVHPPDVPTGTTALAWLPRVQCTVMHVACHLDTGWEGSVRRDALRSVLLGPRDWATEAAIRAMTRLVRDEPALAPAIHEDFSLLAAHRPTAGYWGWERTLFEHWQALPHLSTHERRDLQTIVSGIDAAMRSES